MLKKVLSKLRKSDPPEGGFPIGKVIRVESPHHPYTVLIVDRRYSDIMGFEYCALVGDKTHEWLTHATIEKIIESSAKYTKV